MHEACNYLLSFAAYSVSRAPRTRIVENRGRCNFLQGQHRWSLFFEYFIDVKNSSARSARGSKGWRVQFWANECARQIYGETFLLEHFAGTTLILLTTKIRHAEGFHYRQRRTNLLPLKLLLARVPHKEAEKEAFPMDFLAEISIRISKLSWKVKARGSSTYSNSSFKKIPRLLLNVNSSEID